MSGLKNIVFADFAVFSILSDILISDFTSGLAHGNKTFKGKSYEQLLSEISRFEVSFLTTLKVQNSGKLCKLEAQASHGNTCSHGNFYTVSHYILGMFFVKKVSGLLFCV